MQSLWALFNAQMFETTECAEDINLVFCMVEADMALSHSAEDPPTGGLKL